MKNNNVKGSSGTYIKSKYAIINDMIEAWDKIVKGAAELQSQQSKTKTRQ